MRYRLEMAGRFRVQHLRKGRLIGEYDVRNAIVDEGMIHLLETQFHAGTPITAWYIGLVNNSGFSAFANEDTMSSHTGWAETTAYDEVTRPEWEAEAAADRAITNTTTADFTMDATVTVKGLFVCGGTGSATKGGTTGTLWSAAAFASPIPVQDGDVLKIVYGLSG